MPQGRRPYLALAVVVRPLSRADTAEAKRSPPRPGSRTSSASTGEREARSVHAPERRCDGRSRRPSRLRVVCVDARRSTHAALPGHANLGFLPHGDSSSDRLSGGGGRRSMLDNAVGLVSTRDAPVQARPAQAGRPFRSGACPSASDAVGQDPVGRLPIPRASCLPSDLLVSSPSARNVPGRRPCPMYATASR